MSRLASGGLVNRTRELAFTFDNKQYRGLEGDTLASALIANDVKLVGRSFKYHRPRGILTAGSEEPNALVTLRSGASSEPNTRATMVELFAGLEAVSQNRWPSLHYDLMAMNQLASPLFVAGFYYKTFMWPAKLWEKLYEPLIRRAAGLGALSGLPDPDHYDRNHAFCDLLVIGGGPTGLIAARSAGRAGLRVILVEQHEIDGIQAVEWVKGVTAELMSMPTVRLLNRTTVFGVYDGQEYGAVERVSDHLATFGPDRPRQRFWKIIARRALLATGAIERPIVFGGNDRPGVMMASAVSGYVNRFAAAPGKKAVVFTTTDSGWSTVADLMRAGIEIAAVVEARASLPAAAEHARAAGIEIFAGAVIRDVLGRTVRAVEIVTADRNIRRVEADFVAVSGGWNPSIGLAGNLGARPVWSDAIHGFVPGSLPAGMLAAGAASGSLNLGAALSGGLAAAETTIADLGLQPKREPTPKSSEDGAGVTPLWRVAARRTKAFVDFQHDVTDDDVELAAREGFVSIEHLKRYTTLGMATDQGKTSQLNGHALLAASTGKTIADAGTVLSRPPYLPVAVGVFAGYHREANFRPQRRTASHAWAVSRGATFVDAGQWKRAQWYARPGEDTWLETVNREVSETRRGVGICDVSTLGKIDVHGPGAGVLLDRLYINLLSTLAVGKARYGLMLREDGIALDDGTVTRFAEDNFFVTTTTANAAKIMQHIDYARQVLWPELDVQATSVTEQWSTYSVAGPDSRALLQQLLPDLDLSNAGFPYMAAMRMRWRNMPARLFRLSFSGELAYEISVPAHSGDALIRALFEAGAAFAAVPYGTEALSVMRIEKGHPAGNELSGQTTAGDLGMARMMSKKKDFIGRVMASRPGLVAADRPALVGIKPVDPSMPLRAGGHLLAKGAGAIAANDQGYVTSVAYSPTLGHSIGLALLRSGPERLGEVVRVYDPLRRGDTEVEVCNPVFVDPEGIRVRG